MWRRDNQEPFGDSPADENPSGLGVFEFDFGFPGQRRDRETALWYNYLRDCYDPVTGRYCESDPIGLHGGLNTYLYVRASPLSLIDPEGLQFIGGAGGSAGGTVGGFGGLGPFGGKGSGSGKQSGPTGVRELDDALQSSKSGNSSGKNDDDNCDCTKRLDDKYLKKTLGIDPEEVKYEELGPRAPISRYELCECKDKRIVIRLKGCTGPILETGLKTR